MTITPTDPGLPGVAPTAGAATTTPTANGDFLALILQALAGPASTAGAGTPPAAPAMTVEQPAAPGAEPATTDPAALGLVAPLLIPGAVPTLPPALGAGAATDASGVPGPAAATPATAAAAGPAAAEPSALDPAALPAAAGGPALGSAPAPAAPTSTPESRRDGSRGADQQPASPLTVAAPTGPAPTAAAVSSGPTAPPSVTGQVFPEVTSLVSRGDGTHRITMTLQPEALGEVRVVMTVRDGAVHVRLAAGHEAQHALLDGSSELTRLLERVGAVDTRIVVRDLGATPAPTPGTGPGPGLGAGTGSDTWTGDSRPHDQHAGTHAGHSATDGTHDGTRRGRDAAGANPPRSNEQVTRTRTAGVDVTM